MIQYNDIPDQAENYSSISDIALYSVEADKNIYSLCKDHNEVNIDTNNLSDTTIAPIHTEINILNLPGDQLKDYKTTDLSDTTISPIQTEINILNTHKGHNDTLIDTNNDDANFKNLSAQSSTLPCNVIKKSLQISPLDKYLI